MMSRRDFAPATTSREKNVLFRTFFPALLTVLGMMVLAYAFAEAMDRPQVHQDAVTGECVKIITPQGEKPCGWEKGKKFIPVPVKHALD